MKRSLVWVLLAFVCVMAATMGPIAQSRTDMYDGFEVASNEALVKFRNVSREALDAVVRAHDIDLAEDLGGDMGYYRVRSRSQNTATLVRGLAARPEVDAVEPNYIVHAVENVNLTPNDPSFGQLYGLHNTGQAIQGVTGTPDADIDAPEAWEVTTGTNAVVVQDIDTGIDIDHPDLVANIWTAPAPYTIIMGGVPVVCPAGSHGPNTITNTCGPTAVDDDNDHGTHTAGTIGAVGNNSVGVVGVNWTTQIVACKFLNAAGSGSNADAIECINAATDMKRAGVANFRVSNNSWGGGGFSQPMRIAIGRAGENGILFVAAAGNSGSNNNVFPHYPSSYTNPNIIAVAATDNRDNLAGFSNYGSTSVDLGAPGVRTLSTIPGGGYAYFNGTSMATPHVSGAAALVLAVCNKTTGQLKDLLFSSGDPKPSLAGRTLTGRRLNVNNAIDCN